MLFFLIFLILPQGYFFQFLERVKGKEWGREKENGVGEERETDIDLRVTHRLIVCLLYAFRLALGSRPLPGTCP